MAGNPQFCRPRRRQGAGELPVGDRGARRMAGPGKRRQIELGVMRHQHLVRNIGNHLGKHRRKVGGVGHHVRGNPMDPYVPLIKMVNAGRGSAQPLVGVHLHAICNPHHPNLADRPPIRVGGLHIHPHEMQARHQGGGIALHRVGHGVDKRRHVRRLPWRESNNLGCSGELYCAQAIGGGWGQFGGARDAVDGNQVGDVLQRLGQPGWSNIHACLRYLDGGTVRADRRHGLKVLPKFSWPHMSLHINPDTQSLDVPGRKTLSVRTRRRKYSWRDNRRVCRRWWPGPGPGFPACRRPAQRQVPWA